MLVRLVNVEPATRNSLLCTSSSTWAKICVLPTAVAETRGRFIATFEFTVARTVSPA